MSDTDFEARFARTLDSYAQAGVRPFDPYAIAESVIASRRPATARWSFTQARRLAMPVLLGLLLVALVVSAVVVGSRILERQSSVVPPEPPTVVLPSPSVRALVDPSPSGLVPAPVVGAPCAAMLPIFRTWGSIEPGAGIPSDTSSADRRNGDLLVTALSDQGHVEVDRVDPSADPPSLVRATEPELPLPYAPGFALADVGRIVPSPDGRAVAVEEGDLGEAGCGEPLVLLSAGGIRRPFPVGAFQAVTDLAWAPDGSALYGVQRPTLDAGAQSLRDADTGEVQDGPGSVLRWDAATGVTTQLGASCGSCGPLYVSPDGTRLATNDGSTLMVRDPDGTWRSVATADGLLRWADDTTLVWPHGRVSLDGTVLAEWPRPPAHSWEVGPLSPDGSTIAGMTLSDDFLSQQVVLLAVRDGSSRVIWAAPEVRFRPQMGASPDPSPTPVPSGGISGYSRIVAWAPDGAAVVLLDQRPDSSDASLRIVPVDGSGASDPISISVPDLSMTMGFPNIGPSVAWLTDTSVE